MRNKKMKNTKAAGIILALVLTISNVYPVMAVTGENRQAEVNEQTQEDLTEEAEESVKVVYLNAGYGDDQQEGLAAEQAVKTLERALELFWEDRQEQEVQEEPAQNEKEQETKDSENDICQPTAILVLCRETVLTEEEKTIIPKWISVMTEEEYDTYLEEQQPVVTPEVTPAPEVTPEPEITPAPEVTPEPDQTEIPTPEVIPVPAPEPDKTEQEASKPEDEAEKAQEDVQENVKQEEPEGADMDEEEPGIETGEQAATTFALRAIGNTLVGDTDNFYQNSNQGNNNQSNKQDTNKNNSSNNNDNKQDANKNNSNTNNGKPVSATKTPSKKDTISPSQVKTGDTRQMLPLSVSAVMALLMGASLTELKIENKRNRMRVKSAQEWEAFHRACRS